MDRQQLINQYIQAVMPEREQLLYEKAKAKVRSVTKSMQPQEARAYFQGKAFASLFFRMKRADKAYQAMQRGELILEHHLEEFERLAPLISSETRNGHPIDLFFLRSVQQSGVTLKQAHAVIKLLDNNNLEKTLKSHFDRLVSEAVDKVSDCLAHDDVQMWIHSSDIVPNILSHLLNSTFKKGLPEKVFEQAYAPGSFENVLRWEIERALPLVKSCASIRYNPSQTVSAYVRQNIKRVKKDVFLQVKKRLSEKKIQKLLSANERLRQLQSQSDLHYAKEKKLRSALIKAVPEHYRDLYPLARQMHRHFILHLGPTNSGKTYDGVGRLHGARNGIYLGPLRLLAAEQFETLNMHDVPCSLVTGEEQIRIPGSRVQSSTVEMADLKTHYDIAVIDECQMIADRDRGGAWTAAVLGLCADEIHACASADAEGILTRMIIECGDEVNIVRHERMTPLVVEKEGFQFPASVRTGDALIVFSKMRVHAVAAELKRQGFRVSLIYGALPPDVRRDQAVRFQQGDTDVVVSTDAIAMGMNLPIERVVFLEPEKYDGDITRPLLDSEIKQIAGRAGRYGQYDIGYVNAYGFKSTVAQALNKPLLPLTQAIIGFPESLLGIPLPLTQIISQWLNMQDKGCFSKASSVRMEKLAAMMETPQTDKLLLYRFLCIPFDETEPDLMERWRALYHAQCHSESVDVMAQLPSPVNPDDCTIEMLDGLEAGYRRCDLYYNYARLFIENPDQILDGIQRRKYLISQAITHILSTQRLQQRSCTACKRTLPWNWPYRLCDSCYRRHAFSRRSGYAPRRDVDRDI